MSITKLEMKPVDRSSTPVKQSVATIRMPPELYSALKSEAYKRQVSFQQYCLVTLNNSLLNGEENVKGHQP